MNDINLDNMRLTDLIDIGTLQEIQDGFANATGMAALTTDETGAAVTRGSNFTEFCMDLTRKSPIGCARCEQCDKQGGEETLRTGRASSYYCHAGLVDFAAPIMVNGKFLGSFIGGQVLPEPADELKFRNYAKEIKVDENRYVNAVKKVSVLPKRQIDKSADFLCTIARVLSDIAYNNYKSKISNSNLADVNFAVIEKIQSAERIIKSNTEKLNRLQNEFVMLQQIAQDSIAEVNNTKATVKLIQDIAMNTRILGFNAYVEAARAKENGKGFGVITREIRGLADTSKESADKIETAMNSIGSFSQKVDNQIKNTKELVNECVENINEFSELLNQITSITNE